MKKLLLSLTLFSVTLLTGQNSINFPGNSQGINLGDSSHYSNLGSTMTLGAWVYCDSTQSTIIANTGTRNPIIAKDNRKPTTTNPGFEMSTYFNLGVRRFDLLITDSSNQIYQLEVDSVINFNEWQHLAMVIADSVMNAYVNGVLVGQVSLGANFTTNNNIDPLTLGYRNDYPFNNTYTFGGNICQAFISKSALNEQEVKTLMNCGPDTTDLNTLGYWPMNEGAGSTIVDYSIYGNNGVLGSSSITWSSLSPQTNCCISTYNYPQDTILSCGQDSVLLDAGAGWMSYLWSNGDTTQTTYAFNSGNYTIDITDSTGCTGADSVYVSLINSQIQQADTTICIGDSIQLNVFEGNNTTNGNLVTSYTNDFESCTLNDFTYSGGSVGITSSAYQGSCAVSMSHFAGQQSINFFPTNKTFGYGTYSVNAIATGTISDNILYLFQGDTLLNGLSIRCNPNNTDNPGLYITGLGISYSTSSINVTKNQWYEIKIEAFPTVINVFVDGSLRFTTNTFQAPTPGRFKLGVAYTGAYDNMNFSSYGQPNPSQLSYIWSTGDTTASISVSPPQTTNYYVTVSDGVGSCTDSVTVTVHNVSIPGTDVITACDSYTWIDGNTYNASNNTATYTLTNAAGCDSVVTLNLSIDTLSGSFAVSSTYYNPPNYITATATGGTEYFWSADKPIFIDNAKNDSIQIALLTDSTTLYIEAQNGTSCLFQDSILLRDTSVFICDVYDTTYISVYDTTYVTQIDTFYLTVTDTLIIDVSLIGINPPTFEYQVLVYPNPTSSYLYVDVPQSMISQSYSMEIKNSIGQSMFGVAMNQPLIQINFNSFGAAGSYTLSIKDSGGNVVDTRVIILQ